MMIVLVITVGVRARGDLEKVQSQQMLTGAADQAARMRKLPRRQLMRPR
jgi:hypothetical protein